VFELPEQIVVLPVIAPGCAIAPVTVMANVCVEDAPHVLLADTKTFPLVALADVVIEVDVEVPVQPLGNVQVYEMAPLTAAMV
jgi:hypothetical protein